MYSIAVDGSPHSAHALTHASDLDKGLPASLRIIHVVDIGLLPAEPRLSIDFDALFAARYAAAEKPLAAARNSVQTSVRPVVQRRIA